MITMPSVRSETASGQIESAEFEGLNVITETENCIPENEFLELLEFGERSRVMAQIDVPRSKSAQLHQPPHDPKRVPGEVVSSEYIERELMKTGYPMHTIRCQSSESTILLDGRVSRYYYLQIAIQIALRFAGGRQIVNKIEVVHMPEASLNS